MGGPSKHGGFGFTFGNAGGTAGSGDKVGISDAAKAVIKHLPSNPSKLVENGWKETTHPKMRQYTNSRTFYDPETNLTVRFDKGNPEEHGFAAKDHYHVENPNATGKLDAYLDINGNPVSRGSSASHILPNGGL